MKTSTMETLRWYRKMLDAGNKKPGLLHGIAHTLGSVIDYMKFNCWHDLQKNPSDLPDTEDGPVLAALDDGQNRLTYVLLSPAELIETATAPESVGKPVGWRLFDGYEQKETA